MENRVFISYSHQDEKAVDKIAQIIEKECHIPVWYDRGLIGGQDYHAEIQRQIDSHKFFAFIVSRHSLSSKWCINELEYAFNNDEIRIIPISLEDISGFGKVPFMISNRQFVSYYLLTDEVFADAVRQAFSENAPQQRKSQNFDIEDDIRGDEKYFVDRHKRKEIANLLALEGQGKYSLCFQPENAYMLGLAYEMGIHVDIDIKKAGFYYKISAYKGNYEGKYLYASVRTDKEDNAKLLLEMQEAAEHHSVYALTYLGNDYYYGRNGCEKNIKKANELWKQAADMGSAEAMYCIAWSYRYGDSMPKDAELACMYALMAMECDFPRAYRLLAAMYEKGDFFEQNDQRAIELYEEAVKRGDYLALCYEGWVYKQRKEYEKAKELYERAAVLAENDKIKSGTPFYYIGLLYENGEGVLQDMKKAAEYYLKGAAKKHSKCLKYAVSVIGKINDQTQKEALLKKAYKLGCEDAAWKLGEFESIKSDKGKLSDAAIRWYVIGAETGNMSCVLQLLWNYSSVLNQNGAGRNRAEAIKWFQYFFEHLNEIKEWVSEEHTLSVYQYAYAIELDHIRGNDVKDRKLALQYLKLAIDDYPGMYLPEAVRYVVDEYLFPKSLDSLDVLHAEEMLSMLESDIIRYRKRLSEKKWKETMDKLEQGYYKISECYKLGNGVGKNERISQKYKKKANDVARWNVF